jgi:hypothetical protein
MAIPDRITIKRGLIDYICTHGGKSAAMHPKDIYNGLAKRLGLKDRDLKKQRKAGPFWTNEVRWARQELVAEGYIRPTSKRRHGIWQIIPRKMPLPNRTRAQRKASLKRVMVENSLQLNRQGYFNPRNILDARKKIAKAIIQRRGQQKFRKALLNAYREKCAISGEVAVEVLEAAHIIPYKGYHTNVVPNGLLLRSDLHTLFDLHLITISPDYKVWISPLLNRTSYKAYQNEPLHLPKGLNDRPNSTALELHRLECKF